MIKQERHVCIPFWNDRRGACFSVVLPFTPFIRTYLLQLSQSPLCLFEVYDIATLECRFQRAFIDYSCPKCDHLEGGKVRIVSASDKNTLTFVLIIAIIYVTFLL